MSPMCKEALGELALKRCALSCNQRRRAVMVWKETCQYFKGKVQSCFLNTQKL